MKIDLKYPYSEKWRLGYLVTNKEPRRNVVLFNSHSDRTTVSYTRYLMSVHLGRMLEKHEVVDHINNDKMDDRIENYQILTMAENTRKSAKGITYRSFTCPVCSIEFSIEARQSHRDNPTCSRSCGSKKSHWSRNKVGS